MHFCVGDECAGLTAKEGDPDTLLSCAAAPPGGYWQGHKPGLAPPSAVAPEIAPRFSDHKSPIKPHKPPSLSRM